jgi:hypothetical protein
MCCSVDAASHHNFLIVPHRTHNHAGFLLCSAQQNSAIAYDLSGLSLLPQLCHSNALTKPWR